MILQFERIGFKLKIIEVKTFKLISVSTAQHHRPVCLAAVTGSIKFP